MITPKRLQKGDTVGIVSTARKISKEELKPAIQLLERWGLKAVLGKTIGAEENQFAGSDTLRAADFQEMLDNPHIALSRMHCLDRATGLLSKPEGGMPLLSWKTRCRASARVRTYTSKTCLGNIAT